MIRRTAVPILLALAFTLPSHAAEPRVAANAVNPAPDVALGTFERFELEPVALAAGLDAHKGNNVAQQYFQVDIAERVPKLLAPRNAQPAGDPPRTLVIRPEISDIRFITGGKRLVFGGFAGKSWAQVTLHLVDKATGTQIAEPQFVQHANSIFAGYSLGASDKLMLARLADMVASYLSHNFDQAVGSPVKQSAKAMD